MHKTSKIALAFAFLMPLAGCPSDDTGDETTTVATNPTMGTDPTAGTDPTMGTDPTAATDPTMGDDTTEGGGGAGFCGVTCGTAPDCVPAGGSEDDWACTDGFCEFVGMFVCDDTTCPSAAGLVCANV